MKKIYSLILFTIPLTSCEKSDDYYITFKIKNINNITVNAKIEPISYIMKEALSVKEVYNIESQQEEIIKIDPKEIKSDEGNYLITISENNKMVNSKSFGGFDGYDLYNKRYSIVISDDEIVITN